MSGLTMDIGGRPYRVAADPVADVSLPLDFHGAQPSHFGAPMARARPLEIGSFVGDTTQGGSCNCDVMSLTPHCNGTHTECVGHVTDDPVSVADLARLSLSPALVLSVPVYPASECGESADPTPLDDDQLVTARALGQALGRSASEPPKALLIRTLPNGSEKRTRDYAAGAIPPFLSLQAIDLLLDWDVRHLLVDLPSIDRAHDDGRLAGHRRFWGLPPDGVSSADATRADATITEMIYIPDHVADGVYALSLQLAPFVADAAPSRPLLFELAPA